MHACTHTCIWLAGCVCPSRALAHPRAAAAALLPPPTTAAVHRLGPACKGNVLQWVKSTEGGGKRELFISFPHHKCEAKWDHLPIQFKVPAGLCNRLMPWLSQGHQMLSAQGQRLVFVQPTTGLAMTNVNLSQWFQQVQAQFSAPFRFPPGQLRHIFVDERCSAEAVAGPSNKGAARIMGNSTERWAISYDRNLPQREVNAAVSAMQQWREQLLALCEDRFTNGMDDDDDE